MVLIKVLARLQHFFINPANCSLPTVIQWSLSCLTLIELCVGEGKGITFFIAGCVLWEICQLEVTVPIRVSSFCVSCRVVENRRKKGVKASHAICSDRSGEEQDGKYLGCYPQLWDSPSVLLPSCQNTHTFPEMCLGKIGGLFTIARNTPFPSHPSKASVCTQGILWSSPTCFHRCEANTFWWELLRSPLGHSQWWR